MHTEQMLSLITNSLEDRKARDVVVLDVRGKSNVTDYMVIASGSSNRHVKSVAENVLVDAKKAGIKLIGSEGLEVSDWVLVDLGDVIVHVMQQEARDLYDLESLWGTEVFKEA